MDNKNVLSSLVLGGSIGLGLIIGGAFLGHAIYKAKAAEQFVTVKGLAEREVPADLMIWPIGYKETANDLNGLYGKIKAKNTLIRGFLKDHGFDEASIISSPPIILDADAEGFSQRGNESRYKADAGLTVRSSEIEKGLKAREQIQDLVKIGIALKGENWDSKTRFIFTKLNEIKPAMIEEATKNARQAADQFAKDSGSQVGAIRRAYQGFFSIDAIDPSSPHLKKVRVVTTVDFFLKS